MFDSSYRGRVIEYACIKVDVLSKLGGLLKRVKEMW